MNKLLQYGCLFYC